MLVVYLLLNLLFIFPEFLTFKTHIRILSGVYDVDYMERFRSFVLFLAFLPAVTVVAFMYFLISVFERTV